MSVTSTCERWLEVRRMTKKVSPALPSPDLPVPPAFVPVEPTPRRPRQHQIQLIQRALRLPRHAEPRPRGPAAIAHKSGRRDLGLRGVEGIPGYACGRRAQTPQARTGVRRVDLLAHGNGKMTWSVQVSWIKSDFSPMSSSSWAVGNVVSMVARLSPSLNRLVAGLDSALHLAAHFIFLHDSHSAPQLGTKWHQSPYPDFFGSWNWWLEVRGRLSDLVSKELGAQNSKPPI